MSVDLLSAKSSIQSARNLWFVRITYSGKQYQRKEYDVLLDGLFKHKNICQQTMFIRFLDVNFSSSMFSGRDKYYLTSILRSYLSFAK